MNVNKKRKRLQKCFLKLCGVLNTEYDGYQISKEYHLYALILSDNLAIECNKLSWNHGLVTHFNNFMIVFSSGNNYMEYDRFTVQRRVQMEILSHSCHNKGELRYHNCNRLHL